MYKLENNTEYILTLFFLASEKSEMYFKGRKSILIFKASTLSFLCFLFLLFFQAE